MPARDSVGEWIGVAAGTVVAGAATAYYATTTKYTATILTFAGVLLVALITAFTATRARQAESDRQRERLEAERERQRQQLTHERLRLQLQLLHEREMADLEHVRNLLDDAAVALHDADYARYDIEVARMSHGGGLAEKAPDEVIRARDVGKDLDRLTERLSIRLGPHDSAVEHFRAAAQALLTVFRLARTPERFIPDLVEHHHAFEAANTRFNNSREQFLMFAAKRAGVRFPADAPGD